MTITASHSAALADLAREWSGIGEAVREVALASLVHPSLTPQERTGAWEDYRGALLLADDLEAGPDYGSALFGVCGDVDAALSILINGTGTR